MMFHSDEVTIRVIAFSDWQEQTVKQLIQDGEIEDGEIVGSKILFDESAYRHVPKSRYIENVVEDLKAYAAYTGADFFNLIGQFVECIQGELMNIDNFILKHCGEAVMKMGYPEDQSIRAAKAGLQHYRCASHRVSKGGITDDCIKAAKDFAKNNFLKPKSKAVTH